MSGGAIFEYGWREDHARAGDEALIEAQKIADRDDGDTAVLAQAIQAFAAIAQAHYAAANIRTRPIRDAELPVTDVDWMTRERAG